MCILFQDKLTELIYDGILDRNEYQELRLKAEEVTNIDPETFDSQIATNMISFLDKQASKILIKYVIPDKNNGTKKTLKFVFTPPYSETDLIGGNSRLEKIANISQGDNLDYTKNDEHRCGSASMLNAWLLLQKEEPELSFASIAEKIGSPGEVNGFSYMNVHLAQERLYLLANTDKKKGLTSGYNIVYDSDSGSIEEIVHTGEILNLGRILGLKLKPLLGFNKNYIDQKKSAVERFFLQNPNGLLLIGVYFNSITGEIFRPRSTQDQNHYILVFKKDSRYYIVNSGILDNGKKEAIKELTPEGAEVLLYNTPGMISGVTSK